MSSRIASILFGVIASSIAAAGAYADEDRLNNSVRVGTYFVWYDTHADDLRGPYVPAGINIKLKSLATPYFAYVRTLTEHFGLELASGAPPLTKTVGKGPLKVGSVPYNGQTVVTARWFAPTLLLEYSFFDSTARLRPYVGAGINYTRFYSRQATPVAEAGFGGPTSIGLTTSVGPAVTAGLSLRVTRHFYVYSSISASEVDSDLTADTAGVIRKTHVSFGPRTVVISAGYSF
jgi:outer membrane protein